MRVNERFREWLERTWPEGLAGASAATALGVLGYLMLLLHPAVWPLMQQTLHAQFFGGPRETLRLGVKSIVGATLGASQELVYALRESDVFQGVAAYRLQVLDTDHGRVMAASVTKDFAWVMQQRAIRGRILKPEDSTGAKPQPVVVVSEKFWRERLGKRANVVGMPLWMEGRHYRVIGVLDPAETYRLERVDVWVPTPESVLPPQLMARDYLLVALRKPGVSDEAITRKLYDTSKQIWGVRLSSKKPWRTITTQPLHEVLTYPLHMRMFLLLIPFLATLLPTAWTWVEQYRRWKGQFRPSAYFGFLVFKTALFYSLLLGLWMMYTALYPLPFGEPISDLIIEVGVSLVITVVGLGAARWLKHDQRFRCPVCLQKLRMPIHAGHLGSVLFDRPKEEFICTDGHGYLTVEREQLQDEGESRWRRLGSIWDELLQRR